MTVRERVAHELESLSESELRQVVEYLAFLKYRSRFRESISFDEDEVARLYAEFGDEDRQMAEAGIADYAEHLAAEDSL